MLTMVSAAVLKRIVHPLDKVNMFLNQMLEKVYKVVPVTVDMIIGTQYETKKFFEDYIEGKDKFPFKLDVDSLKSKVIDSLNTIE